MLADSSEFLTSLNRSNQSSCSVRVLELSAENSCAFCLQWIWSHCGDNHSYKAWTVLLRLPWATVCTGQDLGSSQHDDLNVKAWFLNLYLPPPSIVSEEDFLRQIFLFESIFWIRNTFQTLSPVGKITKRFPTRKIGQTMTVNTSREESENNCSKLQIYWTASKTTLRDAKVRHQILRA